MKNNRFTDPISIKKINKLNDTKPSTFQFINLIDEWKKTYHVDKRDNIIFQNEENLTNIKFDNHSFHAISKNTRGAENLPETLMNPSEIWARWGDKKQMVVIRNYILFGANGNYVVTTKDGVVINGIFVVKSLVDRYRRGLLMIR